MWSGIWPMEQLELASEFESNFWDTGSGLLISMQENSQLVSFDCSNNTGAIDVKMDGSVLEEK